MINLEKGGNCEINIPESQSLILTSGYKDKKNKDLQIDLMAITLDFNDKPINGAVDFFFYGTGLYHQISYGEGYKNHDESLKMLPFELSCKEQKIEINFDKISKDTKKIVFLQTIFNPNQGSLNFSEISSPYFKLNRSANHDDGVYFEIKDVSGSVVCLQLCEIYRHNGKFKVRALGQGYSKGIQAVLKDYSFNV